MLRLVVKRMVVAIPILLFVTFAVFALIDFAPGDAAASLAGDNPTPEKIAEIRQSLHLNDPLPVRYARLIGDAVHGDLGVSLFTKQKVGPLLRDRLSVTGSLAFVSLAFTLVIAFVGGVLAALRPRGLLDRLITWLAAVATSAPPFWVGLVLVLFFAIKRNWFPSVQYAGLNQGLWQWLRHLLLPAAALGALPAAELTLQLKASLIEVLGRDFVLATRAKGMSTANIIGKHALKNAAIPVVTVLGQRIAAMIGGAVTIESVFNLPGLGSTAVLSTLNRDIPVLLGIVALSTTFVLLINVLVDISYGFLNPKVRT